MSRRSVRFPLTVKPWSPDDAPPGTAIEAYQLHLRAGGPRTLLRGVTGEFESADLDDATFDVVVAVDVRTDADQLDVRCVALVTGHDDAGATVCELTAEADTIWSTTGARPAAPAAAAFAASYGLSDAIDVVARALESTLEAATGGSARVMVDPQVRLNIAAVEAAGPMAPDLSGTEAYVRFGIPEAAAPRWARLEFTPEAAGAWALYTFTPDEAHEWRREQFEPAEADGWAGISLRPWEAAIYVAHDAEPDDVLQADEAGVAIDDHLAMKDLVPLDEMHAWVEAIEERDVLTAGDVAAFVAAGISRDDLWRFPGDLTAGEIIASSRRGDDLLDEDDDEDDDDARDVDDGDDIDEYVDDDDDDDVLYIEPDEVEDDDDDEDDELERLDRDELITRLRRMIGDS